MLNPKWTSAPNRLVVIALAIAAVHPAVASAAAPTVATRLAAHTTPRVTPAHRTTLAQRKVLARRQAVARRKAAARRQALARRNALAGRATTVARKTPAKDTSVWAPASTTQAVASGIHPASASGAPTPDAPVALPSTPTTPGTGWAGLDSDHQPSADWRPYASTSPFNRPLAGAAVHPASSAMVQRILSWGTPGNMTAGDADTPDDFGHPVYYAKPTDPVVVIDITETWGPNALEGMRIPVPAGARPAGGDDGHMTIVTPDGWEYDLWRAKAPSGGTLAAAWGARTRVDGDGLHSAGTAAGFGNLAGIIRPEELAAGHIDHALLVVLKCTSDGVSFGQGVQPHRAGDANSSYVFPADHGGARCPATESDAPPMGARLSLDLDAAQIDALPVPDWKKAIYRALAQYGGYVGDTGGSGFGVQMQSGSTNTSFGHEDAAVTVAKAKGLPAWQGKYVYDVAKGMDWAQHLKVMAPPTAA